MSNRNLHSFVDDAWTTSDRYTNAPALNTRASSVADAQMGTGALNESRFCRRQLEIEAARHAAGLNDAVLIRRLRVNLALQRAALGEKNFRRFQDIDSDLHAAILRSLALRRSGKARDCVRVHVPSPHRQALHCPQQAWASYSEHCRIVEAIGARNAEGAAAAMRAHHFNAWRCRAFRCTASSGKEQACLSEMI